MSQRADLASRSIDELFASARAGDEAAWRELFESSYPKMIRAVRRRLNQPALRSLFDSTDFIGDVWKSLIEKSEKFDFANLDAFVAFLSQAASRKVIDQHRRLHALKNDIGRDRRREAGEGPGGPMDPPSSDPSPSQHAQARETCESLQQGQTDDERRLQELKLQNFSNEEIACETGRSLRQVQRYFRKLRDSWFSRHPGGRP